MSYKGFEITKEKKTINHRYNLKEVYKIKTNKWFNCLEFLSLDSVHKFIDKEVLKNE